MIKSFNFVNIEELQSQFQDELVEISKFDARLLSFAVENNITAINTAVVVDIDTTAVFADVNDKRAVVLLTKFYVFAMPKKSNPEDDMERFNTPIGYRTIFLDFNYMGGNNGKCRHIGIRACCQLPDEFGFVDLGDARMRRNVFESFELSAVYDKSANINGTLRELFGY